MVGQVSQAQGRMRPLNGGLQEHMRLSKVNRAVTELRQENKRCAPEVRKYEDSAVPPTHVTSTAGDQTVKDAGNNLVEYWYSTLTPDAKGTRGAIGGAAQSASGRMDQDARKPPRNCF